MPYKNSGFRTITFKEKVAKKYNLTSALLSYKLVKAAEERAQLQKFASKITKYPESVRVYTNPYIEEENGG